MTPEPPQPASLNPMSAGCLIPFGIGLVLVVAAYLGVRSIEQHTGPWAIQSAQKGIQESGLPQRDRAALTIEVERLNTAYESGSIDAVGVVKGIDGILKEPLIPLLTLEDARVRRLPASGLSAEDKAAGDATLATFMGYARAEVVARSTIFDVMGPLALVGTDGVPPVIDDDALSGILGRAAHEIAEVPPLKLKEANLLEVTRESLFNALEKRVTKVVTPG